MAAASHGGAAIVSSAAGLLDKAVRSQRREQLQMALWSLRVAACQPVGALEHAATKQPDGPTMLPNVVGDVHKANADCPRRKIDAATRH